MINILTVRLPLPPTHGTLKDGDVSHRCWHNCRAWPHASSCRRRRPACRSWRLTRDAPASGGRAARLRMPAMRWANRPRSIWLARRCKVSTCTITTIRCLAHKTNSTRRSSRHSTCNSSTATLTATAAACRCATVSDATTTTKKINKKSIKTAK